MNYGIPRIIEIKWCGTMKKDYLMEISRMIFKVDKSEFYFSQKNLKLVPMDQNLAQREDRVELRFYEDRYIYSFLGI